MAGGAARIASQVEILHRVEVPRNAVLLQKTWSRGTGF